MTFKNASVIEQVVWTMRLADWPRSMNRARINDLFNGAPPYSAQEEAENKIAINVNSLEGTKLAHEARQQFTNAFMKPGAFFTARTEMGPRHKRLKYGTIFSRHINRIMKRSPLYFENLRSKFAMLVMHGIGPSAWETRETWCPDPKGVEDVMIPSGTLLTMRNLPFFAIYRAYTAEELYRLTHGPKVDPAWQMDNVNAALKWATDETAKLSGTQWPEVWSPEKMAERVKEDSGLFASDSVPVISCWDFYFWNDSNKVQGWNRRIILDAYGQPGVGGIVPNEKPSLSGKNLIGGSNQFLYDPGDRKYGSKLSEIINFQFADLSAVAPFRYHSVRSLGFLLYAVCVLQNRLRCKFNEAVFENLMMYMRVKSPDDAERSLKINLISRGIIDETVQFLSPAERWQVNAQLAELGLTHNQQMINQNSSSYVQSQGKTNPDVEKTAFQVRAELNATTQLISAAFLQAYQYQTFEYIEIVRRFCVKNSRDADVREFRLSCLKEGLPEKLLVPEVWDIEPERVMGAGNKTMEMAISQQLMEWRPFYDPQSQRKILHRATLSTTDDPGFTDDLVPEQPDQLTDSRQKAMVSMGSLMLGLPVKFGVTDNRIEITETLLAEMALVIQRLEQGGNMATQEQIIGLQTVGQTIGEQIQILSQDKSQRQRVRQYADDLGKLMNLVKGFAQRLEQMMKKQAQQQGQNGAGPDPQAIAKAQAIQMQAQVKAKSTADSHAQRTAQRQVQWEMEQKRKQDQHAQDLAQQARITQAELAADDALVAGEIQRERVKTRAQMRMERRKQANKPKATTE
jgi:hypothetical protein